MIKVYFLKKCVSEKNISKVYMLECWPYPTWHAMLVKASLNDKSVFFKCVSENNILKSVFENSLSWSAGPTRRGMPC